MYDKEIEQITNLLEQQTGSLRRARIGLLFACLGGHLFAGTTTIMALINNHRGWFVMLCLVWAWLILQTIRICKLKL